MPPAAAREKENLGTPQTPAGGLRPLHPLLNCNFYKNERSASSTWLTVSSIIVSSKASEMKPASN